jgi:hypothetical protein
MEYRDHFITPTPDGLRWQVADAYGRFIVSRPTQAAACAWVDRFHEFVETKNHELPPHERTTRPRAWRGPRST